MLDAEETRLALKNSLRYFPNEWHEILAAEFLQELKVKEHHKLGLWAYLHVQIPALELPNEGISHRSLPMQDKASGSSNPQHHEQFRPRSGTVPS